MKVALVHDFLTEYGGAERVLEALHEIYPKAPVYCAYHDPVSLGVNAKKFKNWKIITSWGTKLPFWRKLISPYRIFSKSFFEHFDLSEYDLVISSSNAYMAKAVKVPNGVHICYCHTPPRFLYGYPTALNWRKNPLLRPVGEVINHFMRVWDFEIAQDVNFFIANSKEVQGRIKKFYRRDSEVIYPPVDIKWLTAYSLQQTAVSGKQSASYFLVVSRLVASKNVEIAVEVCKKLKLPLKVVGGGKELVSLKKLAADITPKLTDRSKKVKREEGTVEFLGEVSDKELVELYQNCRAVIFPASQEDFGLVPVEVMAVGKPVIANAEGGVLETVIDWPAGKGKCTGVYFDPPTVGSLTLALNNFMDIEKKGYFDAKFIQKHAQKFSKERFKREIAKFVESKLKDAKL
ncbi:MAG: glycosyltransferase [Candidatus Curtissbacteria bacterium]|nr:glycosyltransferase [Candidatus Curtissbacteria bacterium]